VDFEYKPISADGIENCITVLTKAAKSLPIGNFIEGMACTGGCIGGAGCLTHAEKSKIAVQRYGEAANAKMISDTVSDAHIENIADDLDHAG
jgi:iron only hydrogenase large subunit-like protein